MRRATSGAKSARETFPADPLRRSAELPLPALIQSRRDAVCDKGTFPSTSVTTRFARRR